MKILLTGATGLLGWNLLQQLPPEWEVAITASRDFPDPLPYRAGVEIHHADMAHQDDVRAAARAVKPDAVIHLASIGNLDLCEKNPEEAWRVNVEGTRWLAEAAADFGSHFLFASSMYVFDGTHPPYKETDPVHPRNVYARSKRAAEEAVLAIHPGAAILRFMTLYGWHRPQQRKNWVTWLIDRMSQGTEIPVVDDVRNNHMWVGDASHAVLAAAERRAPGVFHIGGPETVDRIEFSRKIARVFGLDAGLIKPVHSDYFPTLAYRPPDATCAIGKMRTELGVDPLTIEEGLRRMKSERAASSTAWAGGRIQGSS